MEPKNAWLCFSFSSRTEVLNFFGGKEQQLFLWGFSWATPVNVTVRGITNRLIITYILWCSM